MYAEKYFPDIKNPVELHLRNNKNLFVFPAQDMGRKDVVLICKQCNQSREAIIRTPISCRLHNGVVSICDEYLKIINLLFRYVFVFPEENTKKHSDRVKLIIDQSASREHYELFKHLNSLDYQVFCPNCHTEMATKPFYEMQCFVSGCPGCYICRRPDSNYRDSVNHCARCYIDNNGKTNCGTCPVEWARYRHNINEQSILEVVRELRAGPQRFRLDGW